MMFNIHQGVVRCHSNTPSPALGAGFPLHRGCSEPAGTAPGRVAGPGRIGPTETRQPPWDWAGPSRSSSQAAAKPSHPRRRAGTEGPLQTRPSSAHGVCAAGGGGRCPTVPGFPGEWGGDHPGLRRAEARHTPSNIQQASQDRFFCDWHP